MFYVLQGEGEHKRAFYYRIDKTIQSMKKRAEFEEKYKVLFLYLLHS